MAGPGGAGQWPDTPVELKCGAASCLVGSPSFFTTRRYDTVKTFTVPDVDGSPGAQLKVSTSGSGT